MLSTILYIDPGTGSMLFSIIIGIAGFLVFALRSLLIKFKFVFSGGRSKKTDSDNIPICIFSEGKRYWSIFSPICDVFEKRGKEIWYLTASPDDPALSTEFKFVHTEFIGEGNKAISRMNLIEADIVLSTTPSLDVFQWKRSKSVKWYVHIPHMPTDINVYRMFALDFYDAVLVAGEYQKDEIRRIEKIREIPAKEIDVVGLPYMDKMKERLDALPKEQKTKKETVVLLAPSWGDSGILKAYGSDFIDLLVSTGYKIIIRPHPQSFVSEKDQMDILMQKYPESDKLEWNRDSDNFNILNEADIMISDFSGVIFDFALVFEKPVIYTEFKLDKSPYDCAWDDEPLWLDSALPMIGRQLTQDNFQNISTLINDCVNGSDSIDLENGRNTAHDQAWANTGNSANLIADYLLNKHKELIK
jgi:hypothetical protein